MALMITICRARREELDTAKARRLAKRSRILVLFKYLATCASVTPYGRRVTRRASIIESHQEQHRARSLSRGEDNHRTSTNSAGPLLKRRVGRVSLVKSNSLDHAIALDNS
ncbi:hypothetical protein MPSEU_000413200 [Mayamaea pseudoterrestris]|nr:hypothetical protein MPSEU_000413200 [Mayamaea pseudoterrestris]